MALIFITADDHDGFSDFTAHTNVFAKAGVALGSSTGTALALSQTAHDVTLQGAIVDTDAGINMGPSSSAGIVNCSLSVAEGGLVASHTAAYLHGLEYHVTNNGYIIVRPLGFSLWALAEPPRSRVSG